MRCAPLGSFCLLALGGAMTVAGCQKQRPATSEHLAATSGSEPIVTLDALFADCFVDEAGTSGGGLVGDCGASVGDTHAGFTDIEYGSADEPVRQAELAKMALEAGATVTETTIKWAGKDWPALRVTHKDRRHPKDEAIALEVPGKNGIRTVNCRDPWGRCETILLRTLSGEYRRAAKRPPKPPASPSRARQELKAFLRKCKRIGEPSANAFYAACPKEKIKILSTLWIRVPTNNKAIQDRAETLIQEAPEEATQTKLQVGEESWPMWFTAETDKAAAAMDVSVRTDSRTILQVSCVGPHQPCVNRMKQMIAEPPPYAGLWAGTENAPKH